MQKQLEQWAGDFGWQYTERNAVDWRTRLPAFHDMLDGLELRRVLEVGCNRGHNLQAIAEILGADAELFGVEPNPHALELARASSNQITLFPGTAYDLPLKDGYCDLVFTVGVLIHVPPGELDSALLEIHRISRRYILAVEYFAEQDTEIPYRGHSELLWKRDFLAHYQRRFPALKLLRNGRWGIEDGFDRTHWWLLEKPTP